ncbi:MAG: EAL domain-containing protein [Myxococcota bacterium]|nr:EAL domain-containing protein [Myxococcota bacterium]
MVTDRRERRRKRPYLEHYPERGKPAQRVVVHRLPFTIGRSSEADHTIYSQQVSSFHAEIVSAGEGYLVRDLGSTNGTFVNGERVDQHPLQPGDILHVAHAELRFGIGRTRSAPEVTLTSVDDRQQQIIRESNDLGRILAARALYPVYQPIVRLGDGAVVGYESLARIDPDRGGAYGVGDMLRIASERGFGAQLSRMMREVSLAELPQGPARIFFNLHRLEMEEPEHLADSFRAMAAGMGPDQRAVLEIHEGAVTDLEAMARIRNQLRSLGIGLAYDDFGAGQSRLMELVDVPPDIIKLDMALVRDIDRHAKRRELVKALVAVMRDMDVEVLAEGIERPEEAQVCAEIGCQLGQGYFWGRPERVK